MSLISGVSVRVTATATSSPTRDGVSGTRVISDSVIARPVDSNIAWAAQVNFYEAAMVATANLAAGTIAATSAAVYQVETATVIAGAGCTSNGTCNVVVTSARLTGSPLTIPVALTTALTTATQIAWAIQSAIIANAVISAGYATAGASSAVTLTDKLHRPNDGSLNIAIPAGLGITAAPSSANTTAGVGGVVISGADGKDDEGLTLVNANGIQFLMFQNTGTSPVVLTGAMIGGGAGAGLVLAAGSFISLGVTSDGYLPAAWDAGALVLTSSGGPSTVAILAYATTT